MSDTRSKIHASIQEDPGLHFSAITRRLDLATGQTQYHLRKLLREGAVTSESVCGQTHYYPPTYTEQERKTVALLRRETAREVVLLLLEAEPIPPATIADRLDLARSTVEWHLSNFITHDIVHKESTDRAGLVVRLTDPPETYRLLGEIQPRPSDRLVDRFTRFTDDLLGE